MLVNEYIYIFYMCCMQQMVQSFPVIFVVFRPHIWCILARYRGDLFDILLDSISSLSITRNKWQEWIWEYQGRGRRLKTQHNITQHRETRLAGQQQFVLVSSSSFNLLSLSLLAIIKFTYMQPLQTSLQLTLPFVSGTRFLMYDVNIRPNTENNMNVYPPIYPFRIGNKYPIKNVASQLQTVP